MRRAATAFAMVAVIAGLAAAGARMPSVATVLAIFAPYAALAILLAGLSWRVIRWSLAPVPFRIPTTCGQEKSLPWIRSNPIESPHTAAGAAGRMAIEILAFRSLFRNTGSRIEQGPRLIYRESRWLWLAAMAFHWSLLVILLRHLRLVMQPVPKLAIVLDRLDGFFQVGAPVVYLTDGVILAALVYLLQRRIRNLQVRYFSLFTDYFALVLLLGIAISGIWMRYFARTDAVAVKQFAISLTILAPVVP
ncbi:MAG TPA: sulfate reduction electron transfer complex DsrMKJOP subunit DsrM, partial [Candidatus Sulfopaludibacter sp.]|nr:sulfate reduction electron transfer complex DsrMKJOP subunit DsrM [Candidatus Sulfopaludibacter sp.]